jgi:hypothetical protein
MTFTIKWVPYNFLYLQEGSNSAALGGALRAYHIITHPEEPFAVTAQSLRVGQKPICTPYQDAQQVSIIP